MSFRATFSERGESFVVRFGEVHNISDGGYERGYEAGYLKGEKAGFRQGYADGLAARTYEVWTITLVDGSVVEKEVALL